VQTPRLAGWGLRLLTSWAEMRWLGWPIRSALIRRLEVSRLRAISADESPAVSLPLPVTAESGETSSAVGGEAATWVSRWPDGGFVPETAAEFVTAYREGRTTPCEIAERFLQAVRASDSVHPPLRAFISVNEHDLRIQAEASLGRYREKRPLGPLDGVPVAIKDELDQVPYPTTVGTTFRREPVAADATVVARLRAAGALLVGKTNMHEIGLGVTGLNPHHGSARNPYDPSRATGGSSSGSAAAVAAGLTPIAIGADGGGSIRIPSALCGVLGLKPTFGRVSEHGAAPVCWSVGHIGPMASCARDLALAYLAIAGSDPADPNTGHQPPPAAPPDDPRNLRGLRIGIYRPWFEDADSSVVKAGHELLRNLCGLGAALQDIAIPDFALVRPVHAIIIATEMATAFAGQYERNRREFGLDVRLLLTIARSLRPTDYLHAQQLRRRVCRHFADALGEVDVIATPTTASTAPILQPDALLGGEADFATMDRMMRFVSVSNLTGLPAISLPAGYDASGLPIGFQLIARPWREDVLLRLAAAAEPLVPRRAPRIRHRLALREDPVSTVTP